MASINMQLENESEPDNFKQKSQKTPIPFVIIMIVLGTILGLFLAELSLRVIVKVDLLGRDNRFVQLLNDIQTGNICRKSRSQELNYEFTPNSQRNFLRINSDGFRGRDHEKVPPPGTRRIAILGDSETVSVMLEEEKTVSGKLESALNEKNDGKTYEVLDFGVPGYNINQKFKVLDKALSYHPDVVIYYYVFNDPNPFPNGIILDDSPLTTSYLYVLIKYSLTLMRPTVYQVAHKDGSIVQYVQDLHSSPLFNDCLDKIKQIGDILAAQDIRFIVVIAPELVGFEDFKAYPHRNIHDRLRTLESKKIEVFDPLDNLSAAGYKPVTLWVTDFDCHKGEVANSIIAKSIVKELFP